MVAAGESGMIQVTMAAHRQRKKSPDPARRTRPSRGARRPAGRAGASAEAGAAAISGTRGGTTQPAAERIPTDVARRLLLAGAGLLEPTAGRATSQRVLRVIEALGFVQIDTISVVERAHHHILLSRLDTYRPALLTSILESRRDAFEHWTHDASIVPRRWLCWWVARFARERARGLARGTWWRERMGPDAPAVVESVRSALRERGPLRAGDLADGPRTAGSSAWWGWTPQKAALEYLWRSGEALVTRRTRFEKVYDLAERVLPELPAIEQPPESTHLDWACRTALDRLGVATPGELSAFMRAIAPAEARRWCDTAVRAGTVVPALVRPVADGPDRRAFAYADWRQRADAPAEAPKSARMLSPFDPLIRDRARLERLFGFEYRFEAFVPAPRRVHGYYVLPVLAGDRFIARVDAKLDRREKCLNILGIWWEGRASAERRRLVRDAVGRYATQVGAVTTREAPG